MGFGWKPVPGSVFSFVVLLTPLLGRHVENWWMRQSCRCKKVSPHNSHLNPGPTVFTASSNLNTFFTFFSGFSFSFNSFSEIDSMSFTSGFEARILLNLGLADSYLHGVGGGGGGSSGLGHDLLKF